MSSIRQGVLRTVRLLPDVVKIGVEPETLPPLDTALPSLEEEEQLLHEGTAENDGGRPHKEERPDPLKELNAKLATLEASLSAAEAEKGHLAQKITALEAEILSVREAAEQREREREAANVAAKEQARSDGHTEGHAEGLTNGYNDGLLKARAEIDTEYKNKFSEIVATLENVSARLEADFAELTALNQPRMLRLWQDMLKRMLLRESLLLPDAVIPVLGDVLSRLSDKNSILIYLAAEDLALLQDRVRDDFQEILRGVKHLELKADPNVDRGSCLVETHLGVYDARWRTQLEQIDLSVESIFQKLVTPAKEKTTRSRKKKTPPQASTEADVSPSPAENVQG